MQLPQVRNNIRNLLTDTQVVERQQAPVARQKTRVYKLEDGNDALAKQSQIDGFRQSRTDVQVVLAGKLKEDLGSNIELGKTLNNKAKRALYSTDDNKHVVVLSANYLRKSQRNADGTPRDAEASRLPTLSAALRGSIAREIEPKNFFRVTRPTAKTDAYAPICVEDYVYFDAIPTMKDCLARGGIDWRKVTPGIIAGLNDAQIKRFTDSIANTSFEVEFADIRPKVDGHYKQKMHLLTVMLLQCSGSDPASRAAFNKLAARSGAHSFFLSELPPIFAGCLDDERLGYLLARTLRSKQETKLEHGEVARSVTFDYRCAVNVIAAFIDQHADGTLFQGLARDRTHTLQNLHKNAAILDNVVEEVFATCPRNEETVGELFGLLHAGLTRYLSYKVAANEHREEAISKAVSWGSAIGSFVPYAGAASGPVGMAITEAINIGMKKKDPTKILNQMMDDFIVASGDLLRVQFGTKDGDAKANRFKEAIGVGQNAQSESAYERLAQGVFSRLLHLRKPLPANINRPDL